MRISRSLGLNVPLVVSVLTFTPFANARTIAVDSDGPADFTTIQAAIDTSADDDTVIVRPGTYTGHGNRDIDFKGKAITVRSIDHNDLGAIIKLIAG